VCFLTKTFWVITIDRLFILYTSGSTVKPNCVVHTTGGYNLWSHLTFKLIFEESQSSVTPGQAAVFYKGEILLGGGLIN